MKKIVWEKYQDPYKEVLDVDDLEDDLEDDEDIKDLPTLPKKALITSNGILPLNEETLLSEKYNLWMAHTNFDLTTELVENIEEIPGVETLCIFSRYRMRIGIGKLFDEQSCKTLINHVLGLLSDSLEALDNDTRENVDALVETIKENKNWAIYVLPNGVSVSYTDDNRETFLPKLKLLEQVKGTVGGQLLTSEL